MGRTAEDFSTSKSYAIGDLALKDGVLYEFTAAHSAGSWDPDDVKAYDNDLSQQAQRIINAAEMAENASDFVDSLVFEPELINGTRYKYKLTN